MITLLPIIITFSRVPPRFGDDDDEDSSSDDAHAHRHSRRSTGNGTGGGRQMTRMGGAGAKVKKSRQLLDPNLPTHCESQIALKNSEDREDDSEDSDQNVYLDGTSLHYVAPAFRVASGTLSISNPNATGNGSAPSGNHSRTTSYESDSGLKMFPTGSSTTTKKGGGSKK